MLLRELGSLKMEHKQKVKDFNKRFNHILHIFMADTKPHDYITIDYFTYALPTRIAQFVKSIAKPNLVENFEEEIIVEKEFLVIGVITDDESMKDSKDARKRSQASIGKAKEKEEIDLDSVTHTIKSMSIEFRKLKERSSKTTMSKTILDSTF